MMHARRLVFPAAMAFGLVTLAQVLTPPPGTPPPPARTPGEQLVDQKRYADGLATVEAELKTDPDNPALKLARVQALAGLSRYVEARTAAVQAMLAHPTVPELRYWAGECSWMVGMTTQAITLWKPLAGDPTWGTVGVDRAVTALRALGKESEAKELALASLMKPGPASPALLRQALELDRSVENGLKYVDILTQADPLNASDYRNLRKLYEQAGSGTLYEIAPGLQLPATIPLKERSESQEFSSFANGYGGSFNTLSLTTAPRVVVPVAFSATSSMKEYMVLDTGSDTFMVTSALVKRLGLQPVATAEYVGLGHKGVQASNWVLVKELQVGPVAFRNVPAIVIEKGEDFWKETAGIVPLSALKDYGILYNRRKSTLRLYASGTRPEEALASTGVMTAPFLWISGRPFAQVRIQEKSNLFCLLDTGLDKSLLDTRRANELGIKANVKYKAQTITAMSGTFLANIANDAVICLGPAKLNMGTVFLADLPEGWGIITHGIIGRDVLDLFSIYIDYRANVLAFKGYDK